MMFVVLNSSYDMVRPCIQLTIMLTLIHRGGRSTKNSIRRGSTIFGYDIQSYRPLDRCSVLSVFKPDLDFPA